MNELSLVGFRFQEGESNHHRVLLVEDEQEAGLLVEASLKAIDRKTKINWVTTAEEAEKCLQKDKRYDLIISDHFLEGAESGLDLWKTCHEKYRETPFLMASSLDPEIFSAMVPEESERPVFLHKPFKMAECKRVIEWYWSDWGGEVPINQTSGISLTTFVAIFALGLFLAASVIMLSPELNIFQKDAIQKPVVVENINIPPLKIHIAQPHVKKKVVTRDLARQILEIQMRAEDIFDSFGPNADLKDSLFLPRVEKRILPRGTEDTDGQFEMYGHLLRRS